MQNKTRIVIISLIFLLFSFSSVKAEQTNQSDMQVHFIDVGQGDSVLIQTPTGKNILIDGGPPKAGKKVIDYLRAHHIEIIDLLIATHPDIDHIGGLPDIMKAFNIKHILESGKSHITMTYAKYVNQIRQQHIPLTTAKLNEKLTLDHLLDIQILNAYEKGKNMNESSIVLRVLYDQVSFLLTGDVGHQIEAKLVEQFNIKSDVLKIGHHGSKTSTSFEFLRRVNPKTAIITYSKKNDYGHPVGHVIANLNRLGINIYSTGVYGDVVIRTDGKSYYIVPTKSPLDGLTS